MSYLEEDAAADTARSLRESGSQALHAACDVRDSDSVAAGVNTAAREFGGLEVVANAATMTPMASVVELDEADGPLH